MAVKKSIKEIIRDEYKRCSQDAVQFMRKYCIIQHPTKGKMYFNLYPFQEDSLRRISENRYSVILKSRQLGLSTLVSAYAVWLAIFQREKNILIIATKLAVAQNFISKVKTMIKSLPNWLLLPEIVSNNKQQIQFSHGSSIKAIPKPAKTIAG